ncbi:NHL repeat-containing protein [Streptomyces halobius]|uniref:Delta-60 repeat protein n=1 Tax=Streptomyces halobius TaxID=2879846 RepID=A0ABY4MD54_9ACTN|nr:hypothetical protein [Streptomyces halobius]UQA95610.1 hypothetical protein K9S39_30480 [Streptomyces halobius]
MTTKWLFKGCSAPRARTAAICALVLGVMVAFAPTAVAAPGDLDTRFSSDGKTTTDFSGTPAQPDIANDVAVQPDGKIIAAGRGGLNLPVVGGTAQFALARYNPDGSLDATFGNGGKVQFRFFDAPNTQFARNVFVQSDGKVLVSGLAGPNEQTASAAVARLNPDGSLDTTFGGGDGKVTLNIGVGSGFRGIAQQSDGKIVAVGAANTDAFIARFNPDGSLDTTYGSSGTGWEKPTVLAASHFFDLRLDSSGRAVVAGFQTTADNTNAVLAARFTTSGRLDTSFNGVGFTAVPLTPLNDLAFGVDLDHSKIVLAGVANVNDPFNIEGNGKIGVVRLNSDGSLDTSFGGDGKVVTDVTAKVDQARDVQVQSTGKVVVSGMRGATSAFPADPVDGNTLVARYTKDGSLDTGFGTGGMVTTSFSGGPDVWRGSEIVGSRLVVAGGATVTKPDGTQGLSFAVARYRLS